MARYVVVMAGGSGTRFWPASRKARPKQFLSIGQDGSLLRQTVDRVLPMVPPAQVYVVTGAVHAEHAQEDLPELPEGNVMVEPTGRNTAPCIGWATKAILHKDPDAVIAVLPADHYIRDEEGFRDHLAAAFEAAAGGIVLFGIVPDRPETGYGYIQRGGAKRPVAGHTVHPVARFVEKPDHPTALKYLAAGDYLWNSGMFVFSARAMDEELTRHLPELSRDLDRLVAAPEQVEAIYPQLQSISIDYGVMERSDRTEVMPAAFTWSDVGSWEAAKDVYPADEAENVALGDVFLADVRRSLVDARAGRFVAVVGLDDVVVVDTPDAVLVVRRDRSQDVKKVVTHLQTKGRDPLL
ncbi:MAG: mannose-1-phosphate guanylyltransferase [Myxococcales bacterium]|nr:mannose-1-phosphate guanylyltransferase [Myxococcales bacterium]